MQTLRRHFERIIIGAVLAALVYGLLIVGMPKQREQRIAQETRAHGGIVEFEYAGPSWLPAFLGYSVPWFARISSVESRSQIPEAPYRSCGPSVISKRFPFTAKASLTLI